VRYVALADLDGVDEQGQTRRGGAVRGGHVRAPRPERLAHGGSAGVAAAPPSGLGEPLPV
jgi:hypothetical protein